MIIGLEEDILDMKILSLETYIIILKLFRTNKKASFPIKNMGSVILYFRPDNDRNRKHYSIVRTQGMKIKDVWINTDKPYTAIAYIEGGALNEYLLDLENAAHDDFVAPDNLSKAEREERLKILNLIYGKIEHYIRKETKIEAADIQDLEGLNEMIEFAGTMTTSKQAKPKVKGFINELNYKDQVGDQMRREEIKVVLLAKS